MTDHNAADTLGHQCIGLRLQPLDHDCYERTHREVSGPGVRAGEAKLGELVLDARQQSSIVAAAALAVLAAVGVPAIWRQRAVPAVGLLMPRLEERPHRLVASRMAPAAVE